MLEAQYIKNKIHNVNSKNKSNYSDIIKQVVKIKRTTNHLERYTKNIWRVMFGLFETSPNFAGSNFSANSYDFFNSLKFILNQDFKL